MRDFARLILRVVFGGLLAGHGAQKLFGWFGGYGLEGTSGWLESMGMKPGRPWAIMAGASEFGGGLMTLLGALSPVGPLATVGAMGMATAKVHWGKPIWVTSGGAELPATNIAIALALGLAGPGKWSVDRALGINLPRRLILVPGLILSAAAVVAGAMISNKQAAQMEQAQAGGDEAQEPERVAGAELQAGEEAAHPV